MRTKLYLTEDMNHYCLSKIRNDGRYDDDAKCYEVYVDLPKEFEVRQSFTRPELYYKKSYQSHVYADENGNPVAVVFMKSKQKRVPLPVIKGMTL